MDEQEKQPEDRQLPSAPEDKKAKKPKDPDHMKYPYLIYGAAFGLILGLLVGYYIKSPMFWTLLCGLIGTIIGGAIQLFYKKSN